MRNRMYGGVRGRKTKVGEKLLRFPPTRLLLYIKYSFILEIHIESGTERREISIVVFDVLERWLKGNGFRQLSFPRYFQRIF